MFIISLGRTDSINRKKFFKNRWRQGHAWLSSGVVQVLSSNIYDGNLPGELAEIILEFCK